MKRNTLVALVVFGVLVALGVLQLTAKQERGITRVDLSQVDSARVDKIVLSGKVAATLTKAGNNWEVEGKPADKRAVDRLLEAVPKVTSTDFVTADKERWGELEVDDANGTRVQIYAGGATLADFVAGKSARGGVHIRHNGDVYAVSGVYSSSFSKEKQAWVEKKLFDVQLADVERAEIKLRDGTAYALVKPEGDWVLEDPSILPAGFRFDKQAAQRVVSSLVSLRAKDVLDADPGAEKTGFASGDTLTFKTKGDANKTAATYSVQIGAIDPETKAAYVQVSGRSHVVTVSESSVIGLAKKPTTMRDLTFVDFDIAKAKALTLRDGKTTLSFAKESADWTISGSTEKMAADFVLDPSGVTRRLSTLKSSRGEDIAEGVAAQVAGLGKPVAEVTVTLDDGKKVVLSFGQTVEENGKKLAYARGNIDDLIYRVPEHVRENLLSMLDSFKKREPPPGGGGGFGGGLGNLDPGALKNLPADVRKSLEEQIAKERQQQELIKRLTANAQ